VSDNSDNVLDAAAVREGIIINPGDGTIIRSGRARVTRKWVAGAAAALALVALTTGISVLVAKQYQQQTVVFDMKGTIDLFMQQSAKQTLDENTAKAMTTRFNSALKESLNAWQQSHDALVLVPPAVVMPQRDITREIQADIAQRMQGTP
jgi:conjugal transfer pilin signal peptidase TrbI